MERLQEMATCELIGRVADDGRDPDMLVAHYLENGWR